MQLTPTTKKGHAIGEPIVSVIITFYNQERFIRDTVLSATRQTYPRVEIIIVDDGSTKPVTPLLADMPGVTILRTPNSGCPAARNFGFRHSTGDYLVFLDGDDQLLPDAVASQLRMLQCHPDAVLAFGAAQYINGCGEKINSPPFCRAKNDYFLMLLESNPIACPGAAMITRESFVKAGLFDESFFVVEDYDLYLRLLRKASAIRHPEYVVLYRRHTDNLSKDMPRMLRSVHQALDKIEASGNLTTSQRRRLKHGRKRWTYMYSPKNSLGYRIKGLFFRFRAMSILAVWSHLRS